MNYLKKVKLSKQRVIYKKFYNTEVDLDNTIKTGCIPNMIIKLIDSIAKSKCEKNVSRVDLGLKYHEKYQHCENFQNLKLGPIDI